jgi:hypothetical protein
MGQDKDDAGSGWKVRSNMLALWLMALATLGSAWSGYQSSLWDGIQIFLLTDAAAFSRQANEKTAEANQQRAVDAEVFIQFARDYISGKTELADFFLARARPELRQAVEAWQATKPATNPNAPSTPFAMPQYRLPAEAEARALSAKSSGAYNQAKAALLHSDRYALLGVLFTASLFLAGLVSGFDDKRTRRAVLLLSLVALLTAAANMLRLPFAHAG